MPKNIAEPSKSSRLSAACALLLLAAPASASAGAEAASFLDIPVGGRPAAMGGAYSALADDAYAPVWNPGGLAFVERTQLASMHLSYLASMAYEFAGAAHRLHKDRGGIGLGVQYFRTSGISGTDAAGAPIADFGGHYAAYSLSYGRKMTEKAGVGAAVKLLDARIGDVAGRGFGLDLGTLYRMDERLTLGGVLANVGSRLKMLNDSDRLPTTARAGASYWAFERRMNFSLEGVYSKGTAGVRSGVELTFARVLAVRMGVDTTLGARESALAGGLTTGVGFKLGGQEFDYAWVPRGDLGSTNYFSVVLRFGQAHEVATSAATPAQTTPVKPQQRADADPTKRQAVPREEYQESTAPASPPLLWLDQ